MTTKDTALRLALEALETNLYAVVNAAPCEDFMAYDKAITACREALAQPAGERGELLLPLIVDNSSPSGQAIVKDGSVVVACISNLTCPPQAKGLPQLPEDEDLGEGVYGYTAEHMRDYARAAIAKATGEKT